MYQPSSLCLEQCFVHRPLTDASKEDAHEKLRQTATSIHCPGGNKIWLILAFNLIILRGIDNSKC